MAKHIGHVMMQDTGVAEQERVHTKLTKALNKKYGEGVLSTANPANDRLRLDWTYITDNDESGAAVGNGAEMGETEASVENGGLDIGEDQKSKQ